MSAQVHPAVSRRSFRVGLRYWLGMAYLHDELVRLAVASILVAAPAVVSADEPVPAGVWNCDGHGVCVSVSNGVEWNGNKVIADAIIHDRGVNNIAKLVKDCASGKVTAIGVPGMPESFPMEDAKFDWLCDDD